MGTDLFSSESIRDVTIPNRLVVSPMCQYSVDDEDGVPHDWHLVHLGSRAAGGAGLVFTEATAVEPRGRISPADTGIWNETQTEAWKRITSFIKTQGSVPGIQLAHAGRKASTAVPWENDGARPVQPEDGGWEVIAPSDVPYTRYDDSPPLRVMTNDDIDAFVERFATAAARADDAGFEVVEIHAAHGYLLHQFLSPITNDRDDEYGGSFENRTRLLREVVSAVREVWDKPLFLRISATDWVDDRPSWTLGDSVRLAAATAELGVDVVDVSSGGSDPDQSPPHTGANYQVQLAETVREEGEVPVCAVGGIETPQQADALVRNGRADFAAVASQFLREPYLGLNAARTLDQRDRVEWPPQYERWIRE
jgi:2,4-dienoyl-CoA reductase-like NADH-dependent reductase (Old Yellow Enzyme family)